MHSNTLYTPIKCSSDTYLKSWKDTNLYIMMLLLFWKKLRENPVWWHGYFRSFIFHMNSFIWLNGNKSDVPTSTIKISNTLNWQKIKHKCKILCLHNDSDTLGNCIFCYKSK